MHNQKNENYAKREVRAEDMFTIKTYNIDASKYWVNALAWLKRGHSSERAYRRLTREVFYKAARHGGNNIPTS